MRKRTARQRALSLPNWNVAFLSQALLLGYLPSPHSAFQGHAAHPTRWSVELRPKGSESTCILPGISAFLHAAFTAHRLILADTPSPAVPVPVHHCGYRVRRLCTGRYLPAHLRRILLMEQQVWSRRARQSAL